MKISPSRRLERLRHVYERCRRCLVTADYGALRVVYFGELAPPLPQVLDDFAMLEEEYEEMSGFLEEVTAVSALFEQAICEQG